MNLTERLTRRDLLRFGAATGLSLIFGCRGSAEEVLVKDPIEILPRIRKFQDVNVTTLINPETGRLFTYGETLFTEYEFTHWSSTPYSTSRSFDEKKGFQYQGYRGESPEVQIDRYEFKANRGRGSNRKRWKKG